MYCIIYLGFVSNSTCDECMITVFSPLALQLIILIQSFMSMCLVASRPSLFMF